MTHSTRERRLEAAIRAPMARDLVRGDTRIVERPGWYQVVTPSVKTWLNEVYFSQTDEAEAERVIDETVATYRALGVQTKWCVGPWTRPEDLGDRLARRGFTSHGARGMTCDTGVPLPVRAAVTVEEVTEDTLAEFVDVAMRGWSAPPDQLEAELSSHAAAMRAPGRRLVLFLARIDGVAVGTASVGLRGDCGYLGGAQVLPEARGRGAYAALVEARHRSLRERGVTLSVTHAREATSAPILERLGFDTVFRYRCFVLD